MARSTDFGLPVPINIASLNKFRSEGVASIRKSISEKEGREEGYINSRLE